jgi:hypothetical protein
MIFHNKIWLSIESNYSNHVSIYKYGFRALGLSLYGVYNFVNSQSPNWGHQQNLEIWF